jgi:hypothetical protein
MPALLGQELVLDLHRACARILERADHLHDVERLAEARIAVDQDRQSARPRDLAGEEADVVDRHDAEVGQTHLRRHRRARQI